jgi:membrane-associated phospholipid phosphatase
MESGNNEIAGDRVSERPRDHRATGLGRVYAGSLILAVAAFVALGLLARDGAVLLGIDRPITQHVQSANWPLFDWVLTHASDLGFAPLNLVSYVVVFAVLYLSGLRLDALIAVASSALASAAGSGIKQLVGRPRPSGPGIHVAARLSGYSFPSGHVRQYTTLFGFAFYIAFVARQGGASRRLALVLLAILVALVGPSRVYLGEHWASDVVGGYLFSLAWLAVTVELRQLLRARGERRRG